ncbi:TonB-dependent receptor [Sphingomonas prati]|uniref:TonB-dependent transporter Oar-like beta-barrel domain-containing protein n=1 Tax=Sphingomonas prati TaxID=1843237 RepID=A0A7W9BUG0_9SPHN|nr:TonB-dependent receptor [Sphingomonas prati]MBB5730332.1 hypothetical protein [Sphingomonas prati]GGE93302.1 Oar protein [Sphingomonas prati]
MNKFLIGCAVVALASPAAYAQETTSIIRGSVTANGAPVAGATVVIANPSTGTRSTLTTDASGSFNANGLRVGGPFSVAVSAPGYTDATITDIFTIVGQAYEVPITLTAANTADAGEEVVITAAASNASSVSQGPSTVLSRADIAQVASINRDIRDLARRDPFASLDLANNRAVSFAGQNPRFNRFSVDGVAVSDNFGLNPDGLPSRRGPVPLDAIGQFQVKIAPFDIREGNFQGGAINIVLRSGTNDFQGTGFYSQTNDELNGDKTIGNRSVVIPNFKSEDYGIQLSGPIIKDKLFFMVAGERIRAGTPIFEGASDGGAGVGIPNLTSAAIDQVSQIAQSRYGYETGGVLSNSDDRDDRVVAKLDANLSDTQRASLTYTYTKDSILISQNASTSTATPSLGLRSNGYRASNRLHSGIAQLNSDWSDSFSTEVRGFYKDYKRGQDPILGRGFGQFQVCTAPTSDRGTAAAALGTSTSLSIVCPNGVPTVSFGPDISRQSNALTSKTYGFSGLARLTLNGHELKILAEYQDNDTFNQFLQRSAGDYYFDSIADFAAGNAQRLRYQNATSLDENDAAAQFGYQTYTFGIQDDWRVNDMLTLTYGARYDLFGGHSAAEQNPNFLARYGFDNTSFINGRGVFQPRIGFNFKPVQRLSFRGGVGIFAGGAPDVYISNSFSNTGILTNSIDVRQNNNSTSYTGATPAQGSAILTNVNGTAIAPAAGTLLQNGTLATTATTNALDPNFKLPSQWRATLSTDYSADLGPLGDKWNFGVDFLYSAVRNQVAFRDIRSVPIPGSLTPDGRQRYRRIAESGLTAAVLAADTNQDILLTNVKRGRSYVAVARFEKSFDLGLSFGASFTYQDVTDEAPATSSTAGSNYNSGAFNGSNQATYGTSNEETKYQVKYNVSFVRAFFGDFNTSATLFGETRSGRPFSYTSFDPTQGRGAVYGVVGVGGRNLLYVPTVGGDPLVRYDNAATQARFENLITTSKLNKYQGKIAPRNAFRSPWFTKIDLHVEQEVPAFIGTSRFSLFADIENLGNLLNNKWGSLRQFGFPYTETPIRIACEAVGANTCGRYVYSSPSEPTAALLPNLSLYSVRVGARFSF